MTTGGILKKCVAEPRPAPLAEDPERVEASARRVWDRLRDMDQVDLAAAVFRAARRGAAECQDS